jgi:hypothetical protein
MVIAIQDPASRRAGLASACPRWAVPGEKIPGADRTRLDMIATVYRYRVTTPPEKGTHPLPGASRPDRPVPKTPRHADAQRVGGKRSDRCFAVAGWQA